jgi:4-hydroxy-4-methyl-2-oxoglutarate aldolase
MDEHQKNGREDAAPEKNARAKAPLSPEQMEAIREFDTCTIANAIETFNIRLRNEGYTQPGLRCFTEDFPSILGFAATCRIRSSEPPMSGNAYLDRTDWWSAIGSLPVPRVAIVQDIDPGPSLGACVGEVHAAILKAFGCTGVITNGAVRDIPAAARMQFPMFARHVAVSHSYVHLIEYGCPVEIFGLKVRCGDLLYADCHGVVSIPLEIAAEVAAVATRIHAKERQIIDVCLSPGFSNAKLLEAIRKDRH